MKAAPSGLRMIGRDGPFRVNSRASGKDGDVPLRHYGCPNYDVCLNLAAALNWESFTCRGCTGQVSEALCWQAHQAQKKDAVAGRICDIPDIPSFVCRKGKVA